MVLFEHRDTNEQVVLLFPNGLAMLNQNGEEIGYPLIVDSSREVRYLADFISEKLWQGKSVSSGPKMFPG
jgi:hypothetical protein